MGVPWFISSPVWGHKDYFKTRENIKTNQNKIIEPLLPSEMERGWHSAYSQPHAAPFHLQRTCGEQEKERNLKTLLYL